jgi:hypothetical protein
MKTKKCSRKVMWKEKPWLLKWNNVYTRCHDSGGKYYLKGIKNFLTKDDVKYLWDRDYAEGMKEPSIDRRDADGHYTLENCRFIELRDNIERGMEKLRRPVNVYTKDGEFVKRFISISLLSKALGVMRSSVYVAINIPSLTCKGYLLIDDKEKVRVNGKPKYIGRRKYTITTIEEL